MLDANSAKNSASFNFFESLGIIGVKNSPLKLSDLLASGYCGADGALGVDYGANCSGVGFLVSMISRFRDFLYSLLTDSGIHQIMQLSGLWDRLKCANSNITLILSVAASLRCL
jgi:hypothetical protein